MDIYDEVSMEKERIVNILSFFNVSEKKIAVLLPIIENVSWMKIKLDEARETIKNSSVAIQYDNGGGQKGIRENPLFKGYTSLWKSYMSGMDKILAVLPEEAYEKITPIEKPKTTLELVMNKHRKNA